MRLYNWEKNKWQTSDYTTVKLGRNGLAWAKGLQAASFNTGILKKEGDGKAPQGIFRLTQVFGYAENAKTAWKMPYRSATTSLLCIDDVQSPFYNQLVEQNKAGTPSSFETMRRKDDLYEYGIVVDYNQNPSEAGAGSCIFMHIQDETRPTSGCTAMSKKDILGLIHSLDTQKKPILIQCTTENYPKLAKAYDLPLDWGKTMP